MTPKEKAKELILRFDVKHILKFGVSGEIPVSMYKSQVKECAILSVDLVLESSPSMPILSDCGSFGADIELSTKYWKKVKSEIEKL